MSDAPRPGRADAKWAAMVRRHEAQNLGSHHGIPDHRPEVAVLACSDARVPPSILFGQEPGSMFVVRIAGNSATAGAVASLSYAVDHLGVDLVVVLGHTGCGAVGAAVAGQAPATLTPILAPIDDVLHACSACDDVDEAVAANVHHNVARLRRDRGPLGTAIRDGRVAVQGAVHDLASGRLVPLEVEAPSSIPTPPTPRTLRSAS